MFEKFLYNLIFQNWGERYIQGRINFFANVHILKMLLQGKG